MRMPRHAWMHAISLFSLVQIFETLWIVAHQTPLSMGFSRQEYCTGFPSLLQGISSPRAGIVSCISCISCISKKVLYHQHQQGEKQIKGVERKEVRRGHLGSIYLMEILASISRTSSSIKKHLHTLLAETQTVILKFFLICRKNEKGKREILDKEEKRENHRKLGAEFSSIQSLSHV